MNITTKGINPDDTSPEDYFQHTLNEFAGGGFRTNGYWDDTYCLKRLIEDIGRLVISTERDAQIILDNPKSNEEEQVDANYETHFAFSYRQYTLKSLLFVIHSLFENRVVELAKLVHEYRGDKDISYPTNPKSQFSHYTTYLENRLTVDINKLFPERTHFAEIRNAIQHRNGVAVNIKTIEWIDNKEGIKYVHYPKENKYIIKLEKASFLLEYLKSIELVLNTLSGESAKF